MCFFNPGVLVEGPPPPIAAIFKQLCKYEIQEAVTYLKIPKSVATRQIDSLFGLLE